MATTDPFKAYKEVRLDLDPSTQASTVAIRLPAHGALTWPSRTAQKRPHVVELPVAEDEPAFKQRHLATAASVYHRGHHKSPRSFLWRVLEDGKVLSIRAVDVSRQPKVEDANLTLRLNFPSRIVPACIALSDSAAHDVLSVFVLTESKHLYTLTLRPDYFRKPSSTEDNVGDWCKSFLVSAVNKICHRMVALTADVLLLSFVDGELLMLTRHSGADGMLDSEIYAYQALLTRGRLGMG
jgi:nuclear pore complex protein Nup160